MYLLNIAIYILLSLRVLKRLLKRISPQTALLLRILFTTLSIDLTILPMLDKIQ